jgi:predicted small metal-binding protein
MSKMIDCGKVNPASGCSHIIRGETEDEVMRKAAEHASRDHGMQATPELMNKVKAHIQEA